MITGQHNPHPADLPGKWQAALDLGFSVFPLRPRSKVPFGKLLPQVLEDGKSKRTWKPFQLARPRMDQLKIWAAEDTNVAIVTGRISGVIVLDLDNDAAIADAERRGLPLTPTQRTPRGRHMFFRHPGGQVQSKNNILCGMDLKADGGYVVGPGSHFVPNAEERAEGKVEGYYSWEISPDDLPFADAPDWVLALVKKQEDEQEAPGDHRKEPEGDWTQSIVMREIGKLYAAPEGDRNAQLNKSAFALGEYARFLDEATIRKLLAATADAIGLGASETRATIASGWKAGKAEPRDPPAEANAARTIRATPYKRRDPSTIPTRRWVYGRQMLRGSLSVVVAPGAAGKTALQVGTAVALASGCPLLGKEVHNGPKRVWLWNLEDSREELERLIEAACKHWELDDFATGDRLLVDSGLEGAELCTAIEDRNGFKVLEPVMDALTAELIRCAVDVLIVDPFVSSHAVSENNNGAIDAIAKKWSRVAVAADCSIVLVHHTRKLNGAEATADGSRGAGSLVNAARSALVLNKMTEAEAKRFAIPLEQRRFYFRTYDDKNNRAPPAEVSDWYKLNSVSLENRTAFEVDSDNIPVVVPMEMAPVGDAYTSEQLFAVQDRIGAGDWKEHFQAKDWAGRAVAEVFGIDAEADRGRIMQLLNRWTKDGWFQVVEKEDPKRREMKNYLVVRQWAKSVLTLDAEAPEDDLPNQD